MQFQKHEMKMRLAGKAGRAAVFCLCAGLVLGDPMKGFAWEQTEYVRRATGSNALGRPLLMAESKDLWENWVGDLGFLDGTRGDGSREKPFQISTKAQLMGSIRIISRPSRGVLTAMERPFPISVFTARTGAIWDCSGP